MPGRYKKGDLVVYQKLKHSTHPGPKAKQIWPASGGDEYTYLVEKFYRVSDVPDHDRIVILTRKGRKHTLSISDPALRKARLWEKLLFFYRFPSLNQSASTTLPDAKNS